MNFSLTLDLKHLHSVTMLFSQLCVGASVPAVGTWGAQALPFKVGEELAASTFQLS